MYYLLLFVIGLFDYCLSMDQLISMPRVDNEESTNLLEILPPEICSMVFNQIPCSSLDNFCQFQGLQSVNKESNALVEMLLANKWRTMIEYLFENDKHLALKKIADYNEPVPAIYMDPFISLFLHYADKNAVEQELFIKERDEHLDSFQKEKDEEKKAKIRAQIFAQSHLIEAQAEMLIDQSMFYLRHVPQKLDIIQNIFANNDSDSFSIMSKGTSNQLHKLLFFKNNSFLSFDRFNGLIICIKEGHTDLFKKAYAYAMSHEFSADEKSNLLIESNKLDLSVQLLIKAITEANAEIFITVYDYINNNLISHYQNKIEFLHDVLLKILFSKYAFKSGSIGLAKNIVLDVQMCYQTDEILVIDGKEYKTYYNYLNYLQKYASEYAQHIQDRFRQFLTVK